MNPDTWTVSELTQHIKEVLELDPSLQDVWLNGEVSNFTRSAAGHLYFTLKDSDAALSCVMWRSAAAALTWQPEQGAAALAHGRISVYAARGSYQLYADQLHPAGLGDLHARFELLRDQLREEGLFEPERKRPLPAFPRVLGVITSPQAAAFRDVLHVLRRRYPLVRVLFAPTLVQGDQAPSQRNRRRSEAVNSSAFAPADSNRSQGDLAAYCKSAARMIGMCMQASHLP